MSLKSEKLFYMEMLTDVSIRWSWWLKLIRVLNTVERYLWIKQVQSFVYSFHG